MKAMCRPPLKSQGILVFYITLEESGSTGDKWGAPFSLRPGNQLHGHGRGHASG